MRSYCRNRQIGLSPVVAAFTFSFCNWVNIELISSKITSFVRFPLIWVSIHNINRASVSIGSYVSIEQSCMISLVVHVPFSLLWYRLPRLPLHFFYISRDEILPVNGVHESVGNILKIVGKIKNTKTEFYIR